jgi:cytochrome c553
MNYAVGLALTASLAIFATPYGNAAEGPASAKADPAKAQQIATQVCAACHGADGNSVVPINPNLAQQHAAYIAGQLGNFKSGQRKNPIMQPMAASLSPEDMRNLGAYFNKQPLRPQSAKDRTLAEAGEKIYRGGVFSTGVPACAGCHSPNGSGIPTEFPRLSGQYADYTYAQLKAFASGERPNVAMNGIATKLTDREMKAVAEYIAGLR